MRSIFHPSTAQEAVRLRHEIDDSVYFAGGTEIMRLGSSISSPALIDISALPISGIREDDGYVVIGAMTTLEEIRTSGIVPGFIKDAAAAAASLQLRNAATIGGNFALRRDDSFMIPALLAAEADVMLMCSEGLKRKSAAEYFGKKECRALLLSFIIEEGRNGRYRRVARSSHSHAAVTAAVSNGTYSYAISGSGIAFGDHHDVWKEIEIKDDLTGSADYKRYLSSVLLEG